MAVIQSDLSVATESESRLKSKCESLGTGTIEIAGESNIEGVTKNASVYQECADVLKSYKTLLDTDASRIQEIGVTFFNYDHQIADKM